MSHYPNGFETASATTQTHPAVASSIYAGNTQATEPPNGLMLDAGAIMAQLSGIYDRIRALNYRLNGYPLSDTDEKDKILPQEPDTLRRLTDRSSYLVNEIQLQLATIEAKL